jgi:ubiquinone/menaquinone biosynthesis C-methylase UbiE
VLDVACGTGAYFPYLTSKYKKYVGVDSSEIMLLRAKAKYPHATFVAGDAKKLQYFAKSFDLVFCMSLFIHMPLPTVQQVLSELVRVSKKYVVFNVQITDEPVVVDHIGTWGEYVSIINQTAFNKIVDSYKPKRTKDIVYDRCERGGPCYKKFKNTYYKGHLILMER